MSEKLSNNKEIFAFSNFFFDRENHDLRQGEAFSTSERVGLLTSRTADVLGLLLSKAGQVVEKQVFFDTVWRDTIVEDGNLAVAITGLRKTFRDAGHLGILIETIPRIGYRFVAKVSVIDRPIVVTPAKQLIKEPDNTAEVLAEGSTKSLSAGSVWQFIKSRKLFLSILTFSLGFLGLTGLLLSRSPSKNQASEKLTANPNIGARAGSRVTLMVIPFRNLTPEDKEFPLLGEAIADRTLSVLNKLGKVDVIPTLTSMHFVDNVGNFAKIGQETGAQFVITGSYQVRPQTSALVVSFQLTRTEDGLLLLDREFEVEKDTSSFFRTQSLIVDNMVGRLGVIEVRDIPLPFAYENANNAVYSQYTKGLEKFKQGNLNGAIEAFLAAVEIEPKHLNSYLVLGQLYLARAHLLPGNPDDPKLAEQAFAKVIELDPKGFGGRAHMAGLYYSTGRYEQAIALYNEMLSEDRQHPDLVLAMTSAYRMLGMLEESKHMTELYVKLVPDANIVAVQYLYLGEPKKLVELLTKDNRRALKPFFEGYADLYMGQREQAIANLDQAYFITPKVVRSQVGKVITCVLKGHVAESFTLLDEMDKGVSASEVFDGENVYRIAQANAMAGRTARALELLNLSVDSGFLPYTFIKKDLLMVNIAKMPEFQAIVEKARKKHLELSQMMK